MAEALAFQVDLVLTWTLTNALDNSTPTDSGSKTITLCNLTNGTGKDQANQLWHDNRTLAASTTEEIDVYDLAIDGGAVGEDPLGQALALARAKVLVVVNNSTTVGDILYVGGEGSVAAWQSLFVNSDTAKVPVGPGGAAVFVDPSAAAISITDTSDHLLAVENTSLNSIAYDIYLVGVNA